MSEVAAPRASRPGTARRILSDDRLAQRATKGDRRALAAIYRRYHQSLYRFCLAIVGNPQDAQDALQNTMVKVLRRAAGGEAADPAEALALPDRPQRVGGAAAQAAGRPRSSTPSRPRPDRAGGGGGGPGAAAPADRRSGRASRAPARGARDAGARGPRASPRSARRSTLRRPPPGRRSTRRGSSLHEMEAGREMSCDAVTKVLSDADGRVTRRRDVRAHLRSCAGCRSFRQELEGRRHDLAALAPLPAVAATGLLHGILGGGTAKAARSVGSVQVGDRGRRRRGGRRLGRAQWHRRHRPARAEAGSPPASESAGEAAGSRSCARLPDSASGDYGRAGASERAAEGQAVAARLARTRRSPRAPRSARPRKRDPSPPSSYDASKGLHKGRGHVKQHPAGGCARTADGRGPQRRAASSGNSKLHAPRSSAQAGASSPSLPNRPIRRSPGSRPIPPSRLSRPGRQRRGKCRLPTAKPQGSGGSQPPEARRPLSVWSVWPDESSRAAFQTK